MKKIITFFLLCFIFVPTFGQAQKKVTIYLTTQYNNTIHDVTLGNNPWGIGLGLQAFLNNKTKFKPTIELTSDIYLEDDKVFRMDTTGAELIDVGSMINLFVGSAFNPTKNIYISFVAGPGFIGSQALLGIKPSIGFFFSKSHKVTGKISYINIFNRGKIIKDDFRSLSIAFGVKLF